jgi:uncharacterized protein
MNIDSYSTLPRRACANTASTLRSARPLGRFHRTQPCGSIDRRSDHSRGVLAFVFKPVLLSLLVCAIVMLFSGATAASQTRQQLTAASAYFDAIAAHEWDRVIALQHPTLCEQMNTARWKTLMAQIEEKVGLFLRHRFERADEQRSYASVVHRAYFQRDSIDLRVVVDSMNLVGGFWLDPIQRYKYPPPSYALATSFHEESVVIGDSVRLPGTLTMPDGPGPFAAVVLVHGAGPHDGDATFLGNKIFRDIAQGMATRGVAVLRYEKRTRVYANSMDFSNLSIDQEVLDDAWSAVRFLRSHTKIDTGRLSVLGHGIGGMMAPRLAARHREINGIALLSAPARRYEEVMLDQLKFLKEAPDSLSAGQRSEIEAQIRAVNDLKRRLLPASRMLVNAPASYYYALQDYDQTAEAAGLAIPILVIQGGKDFQTPAGEFDVWKHALEGRANARFLFCEKCYHQLIETDSSPSLRNFAEEGHVAQSVIQELARWAKRK